MVKPVGFLSVFLMWWICIVFRHLKNATVFDGKAFDSDGAGGYGRGVDQKWITCLTSIFAPFVLIVTSSFLISLLEHSLRASAVLYTLQNVFTRCSFADCFHWICVDRKPIRNEPPFSRIVLLRIVFYEIRKTGNGPYSFNVFCNLSSSVISIFYSRCSAGTAVNANVLVTNCPEHPVKNEIQSLIFFFSYCVRVKRIPWDCQSRRRC